MAGRRGVYRDISFLRVIVSSRVGTTTRPGLRLPLLGVLPALLALSTLLVLPTLVVMPIEVGAQTVGAGAVLQAYTFDDPDAARLESIQLLTTPFSVAVPIGSRLSVQASGAYARGTATTVNGREVSLSGLTDTYVGVSTTAGFDWLVVTARAGLPTGAYEHSLEESLVASVVAAELLPFAIKTWGSGGRVGADVAAFRQLGGWGVGFFGGYDLASEYEPVQSQQLAYRPGDQLRARLAVDHDVGSSGTFSTLLGFERYGNDELSGTDLFRSGNRFEAMATYAFAVGSRSSALVFGGVNHRANGTLLSQGTALGGATDAPSQQLFRLGANVFLPVGRRTTLRPTAEARVFRASDGASQGWLTSAGTALEWRLTGTSTGRRVVLEPSGRVRFGRVIVSDGVETGVMGWEAGLSLRVVTGG